MNFKIIMMCKDESFIINREIFHKKIKIVYFDFMMSLHDQEAFAL